MKMKQGQFIQEMMKLGWEPDGHGHLKKRFSAPGQPYVNTLLRCKIQKTSFRIERQVNTTPKSWRRIRGDYYCNVILENSVMRSPNVPDFNFK